MQISYCCEKTSNFNFCYSVNLFKECTLVVLVGILVFQTSIADRRLQYCPSAIVAGLKPVVVACDRPAADKAINLCRCCRRLLPVRIQASFFFSCCWRLRCLAFAMLDRLATL